MSAIKIGLIPGQDKNASNIAVKVGYFLRQHGVETYYTNVERVAARQQEELVEEADYCLALKCLESKGVPLIHIAHKNKETLEMMVRTMERHTRYKIELDQTSLTRDICLTIHYTAADLTSTTGRPASLIDNHLMRLAKVIAKGVQASTAEDSPTKVSLGEYCPICLKGPFKALHVHMRVHEE